MTEIKQLQGQIPAELAGSRLDRALAELFSEYSRSRIQQWIRAGDVLVDGEPGVAKASIRGGEQVTISARLEEQVEVRPQNIPLSIVYQGEQWMVVDKPAGLVVHPAAGNPDGTMQNALLHKDPQLALLPRAGIVHRLDKATSGLLVVARTLESHKYLVDELQARRITREYDAVVAGVMTAGGTVDAPVGRHVVDRKRMAVVQNGKHAVTHYRVVARFRGHTHVKVQLETGRTHQIRVHMAHIGYPIVGDPVYGGRLKTPKGASDELRTVLRAMDRQALHASRLALVPAPSSEAVEWTSPLPEDMAGLLQALELDARQHKKI